MEQVLRLVAEGRLTPDEAAPILAALDEQPAPDQGRGATGEGDAGGGRIGDRGEDRRGHQDGGAERPRSSRPAADEQARPGQARQGEASVIRIQVRDRGRSVVNLRLPLGLGRFAIDRVPGIAPAQADRVREAVRLGLRGPIVEVSEPDGDGVSIVLE
jgi:hypothetical protein